MELKEIDVKLKLNMMTRNIKVERSGDFHVGQES